jgi:hypothetical protein
MVSDLPRPGQPIRFPDVAGSPPGLMSDLARLDGSIKRIDVAITTPPADGSVAATELAGETRAHTYDLAVMGMTAAIDHLHAWGSCSRRE